MAKNKATEVTLFLDGPAFYCFKTSKGKLVIINICDNKLTVMEDSITPKEMEYLDTFEADGHSDFNWGVVEVVLSNKLKKSKSYKKAKKISKKGM